MQHTDVLTLLLEKDDISWRTILYDLVKTEQMNPWDIDLTLLTKRYIDTIKQMQEMDFRVSGKVLLAAAILLKIKSTHLVEHGIDELDKLLARTEEQAEYPEFFSEFSNNLFNAAEKLEEEPHLIPRTPQPRQRKITIYDLAEALQQAMEVKKRKLARIAPDVSFHIPTKKIDISQVIRQVYGKIKTYFHTNGKQKLTFNQLLPDKPTKDEKIYTFIPLIHLDNQRRINTTQEQHFGDIHIQLLKKRKKQQTETG
jgi:segregation and condensation protein A